MERRVEANPEMPVYQHIPLDIAGADVEWCCKQKCLRRCQPSGVDQAQNCDCPHDAGRIRQNTCREMAKRGKQHVMIGGGRRGDVVSKLNEYERHGRDACQHTKSDVSSATQTQLHSAGPGVSHERSGAAANGAMIVARGSRGKPPCRRRLLLKARPAPCRTERAPAEPSSISQKLCQ